MLSIVCNILAPRASFPHLLRYTWHLSRFYMFSTIYIPSKTLTYHWRGHGHHAQTLRITHDSSCLGLYVIVYVNVTFYNLSFTNHHLHFWPSVFVSPDGTKPENYTLPLRYAVTDLPLRLGTNVLTNGLPTEMNRRSKGRDHNEYTSQIKAHKSLLQSHNPSWMQHVPWAEAESVLHLLLHHSH